MERMNELSSLSSLFSDDIKKRSYFVAKIFPFSLKDDAKIWYDNLPYGCIESPQCLTHVFCEKYFPAHMQHAALQKIFNFKQLEDEKLPKAWGRFCGTLNDEDIPSCSTLSPIEDVVVQDKSNEVRIGPMTRSRTKLLEQQVNSLLIEYDVCDYESFILPKSMH